MIAAATTQAVTALLTAHEVAFERDDQPLFAPLSVILMPGQVVVVRGANGVGKTTLLRCLAGLLAPSAGCVTRPDDTRMIYLGHRLGIHDELTPRNNLDFASRLWTTKPVALEATLAGAGLGHRLEMPAGRLSAGQRKRLALSRLVQSSADLWLLDEPFSSLDLPGMGWVCGLLKDHLESGHAAIIAHHGELPAAFPGHTVLELQAC